MHTKKYLSYLGHRFIYRIINSINFISAYKYDDIPKITPETCGQLFINAKSVELVINYLPQNIRLTSARVTVLIHEVLYGARRQNVFKLFSYFNSVNGTSSYPGNSRTFALMSQNSL